MPFCADCCGLLRGDGAGREAGAPTPAGGWSAGARVADGGGDNLNTDLSPTA
eukprot:gene19733-64108_t